MRPRTKRASERAADPARGGGWRKAASGGYLWVGSVEDVSDQGEHELNDRVVLFGAEIACDGGIEKLHQGLQGTWAGAKRRRASREAKNDGLQGSAPLAGARTGGIDGRGAAALDLFKRRRLGVCRDEGRLVAAEVQVHLNVGQRLLNRLCSGIGTMKTGGSDVAKRDRAKAPLPFIWPWLSYWKTRYAGRVMEVSTLSSREGKRATVRERR
jgi:hypothetical protein